MSVAIFGFGKSGRGAKKLLEQEGYRVVVYDDRPLPDGVLPFSDFHNVRYVVLSPGFFLEHPLCQEALAQGIAVISEIQLALSRTEQRVIGVTGSNGKTTTVSFFEYLLRSQGVKAKAIGNIGEVASLYMANGPPRDEILIVELSSFQLETMSLPLLDEALLLNVTPNHLDRYRAFEDYAATKWKILSLLKEGGRLFCPRGLKIPVPHAAIAALPPSQGVPLWMGEDGFVRAVLETLFPEWDLDAAARTFQRPAHRLELIREVRDIKIYNDSKATSVAATIHALKILSGSIVLILGGHAKEPTFQPLLEHLHRVRAIVAMGEAREQIARDLKTHSIYSVETMEEAVAQAFRLAKKGDVLLLSPACSSFDAYRSFEERGDHFARIVGGL